MVRLKVDNSPTQAHSRHSSLFKPQPLTSVLNWKAVSKLKNFGAIPTAHISTSFQGVPHIFIYSFIWLIILAHFSPRTNVDFSDDYRKLWAASYLTIINKTITLLFLKAKVSGTSSAQKTRLSMIVALCKWTWCIKVCCCDDGEVCLSFRLWKVGGGIL
jgi:hypothetical protein